MNSKKQFDVSLLITRDDMIQKVKNGEKTAIRRNDRYGDVGDTFEIEGVTYELVNIYQQQLGDVTEEDAKEEGFKNLEAYKESLTSIHKGAVWDPDMNVWVHEFKAK